MNRIRKPIWLMTGVAAALLGASCAPVDPASPDEEEPPAAKPLAVRPMLNLPSPKAEAIPVPPGPAAGETDLLKRRIELAIDNARQRDLLTTHGFWTVFHGILGLGPRATTLLDPDTGRRVNALDHICSGGDIRGLRFIPTRDGLDVQTGPQFVGQGHQDQFVAEMVQWGVPADKKFRVLGKDYTFMDFIRQTKARARVTADQELSWAIVILGQHFGTDLRWTNAFGENLTFEDVVRYELNAPVETAACGGTHRLFGLTWVYHLHLRRGGKETGVWKDVAAKLARYQKLARQLQNADGSFSTSFFRGRGHAPELQLRMNTTGHTLEWLALSLPDEELRRPWVQEAVNALTQMFWESRGSAVEGGTLYHAAHGLILYYARVYDGRKLGPCEPHGPLPPGCRWGKER